MKKTPKANYTLAYIITAGIGAVILGASFSPALARAQDGAINQCSTSALAEGAKDVMPNAHLNGTKSKLYRYQQARLALEAAVAVQNEAYADYQDIATMTDAEAETAFPYEAHQVKLADAARAYNWFQQRAERAQTIAEAALMEISDGRQLSDDAMMALHANLGLCT